MLQNKIRLITNKEYLFKVIIFAVATLFFRGCTILDENSLVNILKISAKSSLVRGAPGEITFTFSEEVSGFTTNSVELSGVEVTKKGKFTSVSKKKYTWEITPEEIGKLKVEVPANSFKDSSGNFNASSMLTLLVYKPSGEEYSLKDIVTLGVIPDRKNSGLDKLAKNVLSYYDELSPEVVARYVKEGGTGDGSAWTNATNDPKTIINGTKDASDSKIYLILVASGNYPSDNLAMKNYIAVIGGWSSNIEWKREGVTRFDGQGKNRVFYNTDLSRTALLYDATITNGNTASGESGGGMYNSNSSPTLKIVTFTGNKSEDNGGGMYNWQSSPILENVTFSGNKAKSDGGGMYNWQSSPILEKITFIGNETENNGGGMVNDSSFPILENVTFIGNKTKKGSGGGMFNKDNSSPSLENVTFSENTAKNNGGGMYNHDSSPSLVKVTFLGNKASWGGGGMFNRNSSPILVKVTFSGNEAINSGGGVHNFLYSSPTLINVTFFSNTADTGGGMYVNNTNSNPLLVNTIFWGNLTNGLANQVSFFSPADKLGLHYGIIEGGTNVLTTEGSLTSSHTTEGDPLLSPLADNGGFIQTHALVAGSPAINKGVYVKKKGTTFYFSQDNTTWYTGFDNNGLKTIATPPNDVEDLTATDARGYNRVGRPDIGAYESGGTTPSAD